MPVSAKRKTSLSLDAAALDEAKALGLNVSALSDEALREAVRREQARKWVEENAEAFAAQRKWHEEHGHPLADILAGPGAETWQR